MYDYVGRTRMIAVSISGLALAVCATAIHAPTPDKTSKPPPFGSEAVAAERSAGYIALAPAILAGTEGALHSLHPLGLAVGRVWPTRRFAVDVRASVGFSFFVHGSVARPSDDATGPSEVWTTPFVIHTVVTPRFGVSPTRSSWHLITPVGVDWHPGRYDHELRFATYINAGAGVGFRRPIGVYGFFGIDLAALGGVNVGETFGEAIALYPRWRAGADLAVQLGLRL